MLIGERNITELCDLSVVGILDFFEHQHFTEHEMRIADQILKEIRERLGFLRSVGLGLSLIHISKI